MAFRDLESEIKKACDDYWSGTINENEARKIMNYWSKDEALELFKGKDHNSTVTMLIGKKRVDLMNKWIEDSYKDGVNIVNLGWQITFRDVQHEKGFNDFMQKAKAEVWDKERTSLFYTLAIFEETRRGINDLYDFKENYIKIEGIKKGWQTGGTTKATKLAFNLFNNFRGEDREKENYSPLELFSLDIDYRMYMMMAVKIRFS